VLRARLRPALERLNPSFPREAIEQAVEEKTREVFGDYVSVYDFRQSVEDQATVPLYYENRIPELQLLNETEFSEEMERILEAGELDEEQERKLERELAREYHLITRDERLETIAADLVQHFLGRGRLCSSAPAASRVRHVAANSTGV
jgi:type I site-specific restriction-modification system R (restriction) subunit